jgi:hypothetical protein
VSNRYKPAPLQPNPALIEEYLRDAQPTLSERRAEPEATEARRVAAVAALHTLWLRWQAEVAEPQSGLLLPARVHVQRVSERWIAELGAPADFDFELQDFFDRAARVIFMSPDPVAALRRFLGQAKRGKGRPATDNWARNGMIVADVAELHAGGMSIEAACEKVAKRVGTPGRKAVERIYLALRDNSEVKAELDLRAREKLRRGD